MARTAFEEALINRGITGIKQENSSLPSYVVASDTLSTANGNKTFLESAIDTIDAIPKFIGTSIISGANQIYNVPADIGNLFGGDAERSDPQEVISALDSNLGAFYEEHKETVDLAGFMLSAAAPGTMGVKILNAGQKSLQGAIASGKFGTNTGKALGLIANGIKQPALDKAILEATTNGSAASLLSRNALTASAAGFGQAALEGAAFEMGVAATLFNSPILENQDLGDLAANVLFGAGVYGIIGGTISATKLSFSLKNKASESTLEARPWVAIQEAAPNSTVYEKLSLDYQQLYDLKTATLPAGAHPDRINFLVESGKTKAMTLENRVRENLRAIAPDSDVSLALFNGTKGAPVNAQLELAIGLEEASKFAAKNKTIDRVNKINKKLSDKSTSPDQVEKLTAELAETELNIGYGRAWGPGANVVTSEPPVITALIDTVGKGQSIKVKGGKVKAGSKTYPLKGKSYSLDYNQGKVGAKEWDIFRADPFEAQARYMWVDSLKPLAPTAKKPFTVHVNDIPMMEKVMTDLGGTDRAFINFKGLLPGETVPADLLEFIGDRKLKLANEMLRMQDKGKFLNQEEIAAVLNLRPSLLSGEALTTPVGKYAAKDILALQSYADDYTNMLIKQGSRKKDAGPVKIWEVPQTIKLAYNEKPFVGINNHVLENMAIIKEQQVLYQEGTARMAANTLGTEIYSQLPDISSKMVREQALPTGAGPGFASAANGNLGSLASFAEQAGNVTSRGIEQFKKRARDVLEPLTFKLGNNQEAYLEWSSLNARVGGIEGEYGLTVAGDALEPLLLIRWRKAAQEATEAGLPLPKRPTAQIAGMEPLIPLKTQEVRNLAKAHIELNGKRTGDLAAIRTSQGAQFNRSGDAFYPIAPDPRKHEHFALIIDESITSGNQHRTLFATSADDLKSMATKLKQQNPELTVLTKAQSEDYYKKLGQFSYEKTLSDNYLDAAAHRSGAGSPYIVKTRPEDIVDDFMSWHMQRETGLVREAVGAKYEVQFEELRRLGDEFTSFSTSKFSNASLRKWSDEAIANPFENYINTALGVRPSANYPWWLQPNKWADEAVSGLLKRASDVVRTAKTDAEMEIVNAMLKKGGYQGAAYSPEMEIFANARQASGALSSVVRKANSILATVVLRWDPLNAVNNAVSANVLLGAETKAVFRAIQRGDKEAVGALAKLTNIAVPGTSDSILAPRKLVANAFKKFNRNSEEMQWYKDHGFITSISRQYRDTIDDLTFKGDVNVWNSTINKRWKWLQEKGTKAGDVGSKLSQNDLAEEFNRFVAADVMKQMTDIAVSRELMTSKEALAYINTFVNRTQGNYLAAQRPMMFQGPIGQAIGLFQTYQFNLMQQLLRHVGEGHAKDSMTLLGLQGTIHGMNGLPAFNALNTHLVGNASGNTEHRDAYSAVYGAAGKEAGDWIMYGAASNALGLIDPDLKINLYTRGDINPRHVTIVPTDPASVPIVQASAKVFANLMNTAKKLNAGGDVSTTLLQGLEHNGLSRPLAGLAQTLQGMNNPLGASYSTSKKGNVIASNDLFTLANLGRVAGGKPLDEAIALDATYRFKAYALKDSKRRSLLGQAIKTTMIAGQDPTTEQIEEFAYEYAKAGGRQIEFSKWATQLYKTANLSQANKIQQSLRSPFTESMQKIMGGRELRDFTGPEVITPPDPSQAEEE